MQHGLAVCSLDDKGLGGNIANESLGRGVEFGVKVGSFATVLRLLVSTNDILGVLLVTELSVRVLLAIPASATVLISITLSSSASLFSLSFFSYPIFQSLKDISLASAPSRSSHASYTWCTRIAGMPSEFVNNRVQHQTGEECLRRTFASLERSARLHLRKTFR